MKYIHIDMSRINKRQGGERGEGRGGWGRGGEEREGEGRVGGRRGEERGGEGRGGEGRGGEGRGGEGERRGEGRGGERREGEVGEGKGGEGRRREGGEGGGGEERGGEGREEEERGGEGREGRGRERREGETGDGRGREGETGDGRGREGRKRRTVSRNSLLLRYYSLLFMCVLLRKDGDLIGILEDTAQDVVKLTGFFHSGPELHCHRIRPHPKLVMCGLFKTQLPAVAHTAWAFIERLLHYRGRLHCFSAVLVLFGAREAGCFRGVAALCRDPYRQVPLYLFFVR